MAAAGLRPARGGQARTRTSTGKPGARVRDLRSLTARSAGGHPQVVQVRVLLCSSVVATTEEVGRATISEGPTGRLAPPPPPPVCGTRIREADSRKPGHHRRRQRAVRRIEMVPSASRCGAHECESLEP